MANRKEIYFLSCVCKAADQIPCSWTSSRCLELAVMIPVIGYHDRDVLPTGKSFIFLVVFVTLLIRYRVAGHQEGVLSLL